MHYRREIDGLRALAVLPVIAFHAGVQQFSGGFVGVDVFFVISGYLITALIIAERRAGTFSLVGFYERRARRILPALFLVMLACIPFAWAWMLPYQLKDFGHSLIAVPVFGSNVLFWLQSGYFAAAAESKPLLHTWSLAVEEQYYLVFPLFLLLSWRLGKRWLSAVLALLAIASFLIAEWGWWNHPTANFYLTPSRAWEILLGAVIALMLDSPRTPAVGHARLVDESLGAAGLFLIIYAVLEFDASTPFPSRYTLVPTIGAALIIIGATPQTIVGRALGSRWLVGIGLISYSAYLWHQSLFAYARVHNFGDRGSSVLLVLAFVSLGLAWLTWRYVEAPFRNRKLVSRRTIFLMGPIGSVLLVTVGFWLSLDEGRVSRYPESDRYIVSLNSESQGWYVRTRFLMKHLAEFGESGTKVFLIGDSFAEDFINVLAEGGHIGATVSVSTLRIRPECGIAITTKDITANIPQSHREICGRARPFEDSTVRERISNSDVVILAASWKQWEAEQLPETIAKLKAMGAREIRVIGRKNFGTIEPLSYRGLSATTKTTLRNPVDSSHARINEFMKHNVPTEMFVDFQRTVCGEDASCPVFTRDERLISFDGSHLTSDGARFVGIRLLSHELLAPLLRGEVQAARNP